MSLTVKLWAKELLLSHGKRNNVMLVINQDDNFGLVGNISGNFKSPNWGFFILFFNRLDFNHQKNKAFVFYSHL